MVNDSDNLSDLLVLIRIYGFLSADVASDQQEMDQRANGLAKGWGDEAGEKKSRSDVK